MKVYKEVFNENDFDFWSGAKETVKYLQYGEIEQIFEMLDDCNPDGMSETEVNDFFWFDDDTIAEWLGWTDFETLMNARSNDNWFDTESEYEEWLEEQGEESEEEEEQEEE